MASISLFSDEHEFETLQKLQYYFNKAKEVRRHHLSYMWIYLKIKWNKAELCLFKQDIFKKYWKQNIKWFHLCHFSKSFAPWEVTLPSTMTSFDDCLSTLWNSQSKPKSKLSGWRATIQPKMVNWPSILDHSKRFTVQFAIHPFTHTFIQYIYIYCMNVCVNEHRFSPFYMRSNSGFSILPKDT